MPGRDRSFVATRAKGHFERFGLNLTPAPTTFASYNSCRDVTGPGDNAPLNVGHVDFSGGVLNKPYTGFFSSHFVDYVCDILDNSSEFDHLSIPEDNSDSYFATIGAARTNPSRPNVDVPVNIFELRELPELIRSTGNNIIRSAARNNLRYQFGIRPLVGDLVKLLTFHDMVNHRVKELRRLQSRGLRRTTAVDSFSSVGSLERTIQSDGLVIQGTFSGQTSLDIRVHSRWFPIEGWPYPSSDAAERALASRAVLGLTVDSSTLWNAIPWSWLIDWCSNAGQYFSATRNIVGAGLGDISVMRHTKTVWTWGGASADDWSCTPIDALRTNKTRATSFVAPSAQFPFLSGNQLGILGSLAVSRM